MLIQQFSVLIGTLLAAAFLLPVVSRLFVSIGLLDKPADHKLDVRPIPLSGGLTILTIATLALLLLGDISTYAWVLTAVWALSLLGTLDDKYRLPPMLRCVGQTLIVFVFVVYLGDVRVESLGGIVWFDDKLELATLPSWIFTSLCMVALINAFNMLDGIDGLAGILFVLMAGALWWISPGAVASTYGLFFAVFIGSTLGFLVHNARSPWTSKARAYLGDAGSMSLSLVLAILAIWATQPDSAAKAAASPSPILPVWILALPIMELGASTARRLLGKRSPMSPDRGHIHHRLANLGLNTNQIVLTITSITAAMIVLGISLHETGVSDFVSFTLCMIFFLVYMVLVNLPGRRAISSSEARKPQDKGIINTTAGHTGNRQSE